MTLKYYAILILILASNCINGQTSLAIKTQGNTLEDFVPKNWKMIDTATGDLNKDKVDDAAIVIQEMDPKKIEINNGMGVDTLDANPRILIVVFKDTVSGNFKLKELSKTFILSHDSPTMDDPFDGIKIEKGILGIGFHLWYSAGSWYQTFLEYKFRFQKNEFYLIGAEFSETHRATMDNITRSFNFSTKKMNEKKTIYEETTEGEEPAEKTTEQWIDLKIEMKTLKTIEAPLRWKVAPDVVI